VISAILQNIFGLLAEYKFGICTCTRQCIMYMFTELHELLHEYGSNNKICC